LGLDPGREVQGIMQLLPESGRFYRGVLKCHSVPEKKKKKERKNLFFAFSYFV
jgi:hypothetical protein